MIGVSCILLISLNTTWALLKSTATLLTLPDYRNESFHLTIIHQNDIHSHFGLISRHGYKCNNHEDKTCYGGFSRAVHYVKDIIENDPYSKNLLVVNTGDFYKGNELYSEFKWRLIADMVQRMPYTALTLGDAEFTDGIDGLVPFLRAIGEKFVCTNIDFGGISNATLQQELRTLCPKHRVLSFDSPMGPRHVCLLGYTTPLTTELMADRWAHFEDEVTALTREIQLVRAARPEVKIFVALGHSGYARDLQIAHRVPSLDVVIGGHSHSLLWPNIRNDKLAGVPADEHDQQFAKGPYPTVVRQPSGRYVLVAQMYKHGKYLGVLNVTFNRDDEITDWFADPVLLTDEMASDVETERSLDKYRLQMRDKQQQVIGSSLVDLSGDNGECLTSECSIGNLITDAMLWHVRHYSGQASRALAAVINGGAIWQGMKAGKLKMADIADAIPVPDTLNIVELRGITILQMLEHGLATTWGFLQVAGMYVRYNMSRPLGSRVETVHMLCQDCVTPEYVWLNLSKTYHVAMFTFLAVGNDGFDMITRDRISKQRRHDVSVDIVVNYVRQFSPIHTAIDGRIEIYSAPTENNTAAARPRYWATAAAAGGAALAVALLA